MTYLFGNQKDSTKIAADFILSASDGNITITSAKADAKRVLEVARFLGNRKYNQFEKTVTHILQGVPANASVLFTDDGIGAINNIVHTNYIRFPVV